METASTVTAPANNTNDRSTLQVYLKKTVGKGSFGRVKYCVATVDDEPVGFAVKIIDKQSVTYRYNSSAIEREISILKKIHHPNLILFIKIVNYRHYVYMYMEYCRCVLISLPFLDPTAVGRPFSTSVFRHFITEFRFFSPTIKNNTRE